MVDTWRGQIRLRNWPRKRGPSKNFRVKRQNDWFTGANKLAKIVEPVQQNLAIALAKGTGRYPRDLILNAMSGGIYSIVLPEGPEIKARKRYREELVFNGAILEKSATQGLPAGLSTAISFLLPVLDTNGFWSPGAPTLFTIPAGVEIVSLEAGFQGTLAPANNTTSPHIVHNGVIMAVSAARISGNSAGVVTKGAVAVAEGDTFEFRVFTVFAEIVAAGPETHFTLEVLQSSAS